MVNKCCAPGCRSGYVTQNGDEQIKLSFFKFPTDQELRKKWIHKVPRRGWVPTSNTVLCEKHFRSEDFQSERIDKTFGRAEKRGKLQRKFVKPDAFPTIWPNLSEHLTKEQPVPRATSNETSSSRQILVLHREAEEQLKKQFDDSFSSLTELSSKFSFTDIKYTVIKSEIQTSFLALDVTVTPTVIYSLKLFENLNYEVWCDGRLIKFTLLEKSHAEKLPEHINSFDMLCKILLLLEKFHESNTRDKMNVSDLIDEVIELLHNPKLCNNPKICFLIEQLSLAFRKPCQRRYSSSLLAMAVTWQKISPAAYKQIFEEGILTLPTERYIRHLISAISVDMKLGVSTKAYLTARKSKLADKDLLITIIIDEIYTSKQVQYNNGKFHGIEGSDITKTLLCIMIKSIAGKYRDVIAMTPCSSLNAKKQYGLWKNILLDLCDMGFEPIITMTDGNHMNHKFYKEFICEGTMKTAINFPLRAPLESEFRLIYLMFDTVHLFKCFITILSTKNSLNVLLSIQIIQT